MMKLERPESRKSHVIQRVYETKKSLGMRSPWDLLFLHKWIKSVFETRLTFCHHLFCSDSSCNGTLVTRGMRETEQQPHVFHSSKSRLESFEFVLQDNLDFFLWLEIYFSFTLSFDRTVLFVETPTGISYKILVCPPNLRLWERHMQNQSHLVYFFRLIIPHLSSPSH
jgi:hypothetical protein